MEMLKVAAVAVAAALCCCVLRRLDAGFGTAAALGAGVLILTLLIGNVSALVETLRLLTGDAGISDGCVQVLLKVVGVCFLAETAAGVCRDAAEEGLARKVEMAGRVLTMVMGLPVLSSLMKEILELAP